MKVLVVSADRTEPHGGARNLGDAFLSDALAAAISERGHDVRVYDFGPTRRRTSDLTRTHGRLRSLVAEIRASDCVLVGGGTMLQDNRPDRLVGGLPRLCLAVAWAARLCGRPLAFYGVGLDPIERRVPRHLIRSAVRGSEVWLRESQSRDRFREYFRRDARLAADAALLVRPEMMPRRSEERRLLIALNRADAPQLTPEVLEYLASSYDEVSFLSMDQEPGCSDGEHLPRETREQLAYEPAVRGWSEAAHLIASSSAVVASRMHALYLAMLLDVPSVAVGGHVKVATFCSEFGVPQIDRLETFTPEVTGLADPTALQLARQRAFDSLTDALAWLGRES